MAETYVIEAREGGVRVGYVGPLMEAAGGEAAEAAEAAGEPGRGRDIVSIVADAYRFDTRADAEAMIGRMRGQDRGREYAVAFLSID